jgi:SpoVK/Ycf46/Vps4 family AAA+-type ATPase
MEDIASVDLKLKSDPNHYSDAAMRVILKGKPGASLRPHRFSCYFYTADYYPVCEGEQVKKIKNGRPPELILNISCDQIWIPGKYILMIRDDLDLLSVMRIDFSLDERMMVTLESRKNFGPISFDNTLVSCLQCDNGNWTGLSRTPGAAQMRHRAILSTQMALFNEYRKEDGHGELRSCKNLLVAMNNPTVDFLGRLAMLIDSDYGFKYIDCASLYDLSCNNPYEPLQEKFDDTNMKLLCLTRIQELSAPTGKVALRKIIDKVRLSGDQTLIWLCGTRCEIETLLNVAPSLKQFFQADSWVEQQPSTPYELAQAFYTRMEKENLELSLQTKDHLARAVIEGCEKDAITSWSSFEVNQFVEKEILPRYFRRVLLSETDGITALLEEEDIPFDKLTNATSTYEQSISELNAMVGLEGVKQGICTMANQSRFFLERRKRGLNTNGELAYHAIFTGNPGTGKTTVARQLGKIYHALGLLSKGEVISVDRTKLVGQYIGQTEDNMKLILEEAKGNVLFIDEAYTLVTCSDDKKDFGRRVLDSLLTVLTQPNPDMLIVFAGYENEMQAMLSTNVGLAGRFPYRYHFDDYSAEQLIEIARRLFERDDYLLTSEAAQELQKTITQTVAQKSDNFGNARWIEQFVRNGIIPAMADRIFSSGSNDFQHIEVADIVKAYKKYNPKVIELKPARHIVSGFSA